jgi:DNA-binding NarL/FixJ family response regulator
MNAASEPRQQMTVGAAKAVIVADDHDLVRIGLSQLLTHRDPTVMLGEAADGPALEALLAGRAHWDLMLLDLAMPGFGGEVAVRDLLARFPAIPILVVSGTSDAAMMVRLLDAGVAGFLPKSLDGQLMLKAIDLVLAGGRYVPPDVLRAIRGVQGTMPGGTGSAFDPTDVTPRQREILALLAQGLPNKVIAARLGIAEATVKMHVTALLRAYGVQSRSELLARLR